MSQVDPSPGQVDTQVVGDRIRHLRQAKGISARELADRAELSAAYVSRLENAKVSPTVATLSRVVQALGETITSLFGEVADEGPVVRAAERRRLISRGVCDYRVTPAWASRLEVLESVVQPGEGSGAGLYRHPGDEECVLVLDGELSLWLGDDEHQLGPGDSATYQCRSLHRWHNASEQAIRVLWIITPASY